MTSFFSGPIWIKFRRLVQNDISTAVIWPKSKPEFQYSGRIKWYVISEPRITLQGAATWLIHCHVPRATCHIAGCKNSIRHIENRFSPYFFLFLMQFRLWRAAALVSSPIHLLCITSSIKRLHLCRKLLQFEVDIITINRYHSQKISWENTEYARANASFIHKIFKTTVVVCFY